MKATNCIMVLSCVMILCFSCSKSNTKPGPVTGSVTIDGTVYPTVIIGNQIWTTQNYSGNTVEGPTLNVAGTDGSTGKYYQIGDNFTLPAGWRLPTRADFNTLVQNYPSGTIGLYSTVNKLSDSEHLYATSGWTGISPDNASGFNAYPAGVANYSPSAGSYTLADKGTDAFFLSSVETDNNDTFASELVMDNANGAYVTKLNYTGSNAIDPYISVRFVKDK